MIETHLAVPFVGGFGFPGMHPGFGAFPQGGFPQGGQQAGFSGAPQGGNPTFTGTLDNRFGENEPGVVTGGSTQIVTGENGNFHSTTSILKPNGEVITTQHHGKHPKKP